MTKDEALQMCIEYIETNSHERRHVRWAIKDALAQPEPVKIAHKHEWFRTGEMKVGQMRCISCGTWGQEEMPQRTWVGLTKKEFEEAVYRLEDLEDCWVAIEAALRSKND